MGRKREKNKEKGRKNSQVYCKERERKKEKGRKGRKGSWKKCVKSTTNERTIENERQRARNKERGRE